MIYQSILFSLGIFHLVHWHFNWAEKKYQLGEDFFIYHISFGRIILIHLVPLPLARQCMLPPVHHGEVEVGF
jgi:hypothetical protein